MLTKRKGKRLINSFGALRGVEVPEELTDDDLPYMLMLYTYRKGSGYNFPSNGLRTYHEILHQSAKGYWLAQGNGYTQNQSEAYAFTLDQMLQFAFNLDGCAPQTILNILKGTHYTLLCKVAHNYKTITPKAPQRPPKQYGVFLSVVKPLLKCQGA